MNANTRKSIDELLRCIKLMDQAFTGANHAYNTEEEQRKKQLDFCHAVGVVCGQGKIVDINLSIYEKSDQPK